MASTKNRTNKLWLKQGGLCCYCEKPMTRFRCAEKKGPPPHNATIEHLKRREEGGTGALDNLALAHSICNSGRGAIDWFTYKSYMLGELSY